MERRSGHDEVRLKEILSLQRHEVDFVLYRRPGRNGTWIGDPELRRGDAGEDVPIEGVVVRVASIDHLIAMKEAAGRPKDKLMATEYRVLSDILRAPRYENVP